MSGRRIDVSATQVVASMLAAVTGAVAASYLGVAGTLIGAAIASVASTAVAGVYKHYLARSQERLRKAAEVLGPRAGLSGIARHPGQQQTAGEPTQEGRDSAGRADEPTLRAASARAAGSAAAAGSTRTGGSARTAGDSGRTASGSLGTAWNPAAQVRPSSPDYLATEAFPKIGDHPPGWAADGDEGPTEALQRMGGGPNPGRARDSAGLAETSRDSAVTAETSRDTAGTSPDAAVTGETSRDTAGTSPDAAVIGETSRDSVTSGRMSGGRRRWMVLAGVALAVFLFAMGGITAFEVAAGKPLTSVLRHQGGSGTTFGDLVGSHARRPSSPAKPRPTTHPSTGRATQTPSQSPPPTPSPSLTPSLSPTPTSTPTAAPSSPVHASPSPSGPAS